MSERFPFTGPLPRAAEPAVSLVRELTDAGHEALLAGGCVRDLLLGRTPQDYDVATSAPPDEVCALFRPTRKVGVQFGVVLVKRRRRWIEVATFRTDGPYEDGRRPSSVTLTNARHDALRRDFTVNGMFLDPLTQEVVDYVNGGADLDAGVIRAIGDPAERFAEDYLRLLRAVRFAARLKFELETQTLGAIRQLAARAADVAAERVREELEKMLAHPHRRQAWDLLHECGLTPHLWPGAKDDVAPRKRVGGFFDRLPADSSSELALAFILANCDQHRIESVGRALTLANEQIQTIRWLVAHQGDLDEPAAPSCSAFKRLLAHPAFDALHALANARYTDLSDAESRADTLTARIAEIPKAAIAPPPFVRGDDLIARGLRPGPAFTEILDGLYTRQLEEEFADRDAALHALEATLIARPDLRGESS